MKTSFHRFGLVAGLIVTLIIAAGCQSSHPHAGVMPANSVVSATTVQTKESQSAMTPQQALAELKAGNARFVAGKPLHP